MIYLNLDMGSTYNNFTYKMEANFTGSEKCQEKMEEACYCIVKLPTPTHSV